MSTLEANATTLQENGTQALEYPRSSNGSDRPHVVIVGAGFAGLNAAKTLQKAPVDITIVDRNNYHKFQPLLYEVAMAGLEPDDIARNVRSIFHRQDNVEFRLGTVHAIDKDEQVIHLRGGDPMHYDYLILAAGAVSTDFGIEGVKDYGFPLKNISDAVNLRNHVLRQFERYNRLGPEDAGPGALNFVIVGGGPTGVETAGAFVELFGVLQGDYPNMDTEAAAQCILVEMSDSLLQGYYGDKLREYTQRVLEKRGVDVRTNTAVERVEKEGVHTKEGSYIPTQTLIWAAGVKASPIAEALDTELDRGGRVVVEDDLSVPGYPNIFVAGDMAATKDDDGELLGQVAQVAIQAGTHAAKQIHALRQDRPTTRFEYNDLGQMATIGRNAAVAELAGGIEFKGFIAWFLWVFIHIAKLVGFRNRLNTFINWAYNYFTYNRASRLILDVVPVSEDIPMEIEDVDEQIQKEMKRMETQPSTEA